MRDLPWLEEELAVREEGRLRTHRGSPRCPTARRWTTTTSPTSPNSTRGNPGTGGHGARRGLGRRGAVRAARRRQDTPRGRPGRRGLPGRLHRLLHHPRRHGPPAEGRRRDRPPGQQAAHLPAPAGPGPQRGRLPAPKPRRGQSRLPDDLQAVSERLHRADLQQGLQRMGFGVRRRKSWPPLSWTASGTTARSSRSTGPATGSNTASPPSRPPPAAPPPTPSPRHQRHEVIAAEPSPTAARTTLADSRWRTDQQDFSTFPRTYLCTAGSTPTPTP